MTVFCATLACALRTYVDVVFAPRAADRRGKPGTAVLIVDVTALANITTVGP